MIYDNMVWCLWVKNVIAVSVIIFGCSRCDLTKHLQFVPDQRNEDAGTEADEVIATVSKGPKSIQLKISSGILDDGYDLRLSSTIIMCAIILLSKRA